MAAPENLFDPRHYAGARRPFLEAETLPPWCYTSQAFFDREVERIFLKTWNFVGRVDEIPEAGDYLTLEMFGESVFAIRNRAGEVRAFANTCSHRGTRLLDGSGGCRAIICPYHGWTFDLDGALVGARGMEQTLDFDKSEHGLKSIRIETWAGFMFVNFDPGATSLTEHLGDLQEKFASYNFSDMVCVRRRAYDLDCNWKIYLENAMEDYHTPVVHRGSIGLQATVPEETDGQWDSIRMESETTIAVLPEDSTPFSPIAGLSGPLASGSYFTVIYPSIFFGTTHDCMWWLQQLPHGPERTTVVVGSCFPRETVARSDFEPAVETYFHRWDTSVPEDNMISERQQAGLRSSLSAPGRLSINEPIVHTIGNWVLDRVLGDAGSR